MQVAFVVLTVAFGLADTFAAAAPAAVADTQAAAGTSVPPATSEGAVGKPAAAVPFAAGTSNRISARDLLVLGFRSQ